MIASDIPVLREVLGHAPYFVDPYDVSAIASGIIEVVADSALRRRLIPIGIALSRDYTWQKAADTLVALIRETGGPSAA